MQARSMDITSYEDNENISDVERLILRVEGNDPTLIEIFIVEQEIRPHNILDWERLGNAIGKNTHIRKVHFDGFGRNGWSRAHGWSTPPIEMEYLLKFLSGFALNRSIQKLILWCCNFPDKKVWDALAQFFMHNQALEHLKLKKCFMRGMIHSGLASALQKFDTLKKFTIDDQNRCDGGYDGGYGDFSDGTIAALIGHTYLVKLSLLDVNIGNACCAEMSALLQNPRSNLRILHLDSNNISEVGECVIGNGIALNNSLVELDLSYINEHGIFDGLQCSKLRLETLVVSAVWGNEENILSLSRVLLNNVTTLQTLELSIHDNSSDDPDVVTIVGWSAIFNILCQCNCVLEELDLGIQYLDNEGMDALATALANNSSLRQLVLHGSSIAPGGYAAFTNTLCNRSSIMETYQSNHTLEKLCGEYKLPQELISLLRLNRKNCNSDAARLKIIMMHFSDSEINMLPFVNMDLIVRPHAIAWMVRDLHSYQLFRAMPSLLEKFNMKEESDRREEADRREEVNCMRMELTTIHERNPAAFVRLTAEIVEAAANRKRGDVPPLENPSIEQRKRHKEDGGVDE